MCFFFFFFQPEDGIRDLVRSRGLGEVYKRQLHSVIISRGPRRGQSDERHPSRNYFWGWNPIPGFVNPNAETVAMSHLRNSWPVEGWNDPISSSWKDDFGNTESVSYTHLRAHETVLDLVCRLLLEKKTAIYR